MAKYTVHIRHAHYSVLILTFSIGNETQVKSCLEVTQSQDIKEDKSQQGLYKMTQWKGTAEEARSTSVLRKDDKSLN